MPTPEILTDIGRLMIQLLPAIALVCLVLAGIALRLEGESTLQLAVDSRSGFSGESSC
jgi:hypothetical protein